jgi:hypothetical protein
MNFILKEKITSDIKAKVLANGSISGVNLKKFKPDENVRCDYRKKLKISNSDLIFLFLGRLKQDKGVLDLCK